MPQAFACYREFAPSVALREHVRTFFSFAPPAEVNPSRRPVTREVLFCEGDSFCSPLFADGHVSIVFSFERECCLDGFWRQSPGGPNGKVIGAMSGVGPPSSGERSEMIGVYFHAAKAPPFTGVPTCALTDRIVDLEDLWGVTASELATEFNQAAGLDRIDRLESALIRRMAGAQVSTITPDVPGLAAWVLRQRDRLTVHQLADAAGLSRQHLTRVFRDRVGVAPKIYCRLARFHSALAYAGSGKNFDWARIAVELGYADQSHMIAEFREFSSLTPQRLATGQWFHPFIERAREKLFGSVHRDSRAGRVR